MTLRVGRLALPGVVEAHGIGTGEVTMAGFVDVADLADARTVAAQVVALAGGVDEPVVPVVLTDGWAGYGRVTGASWDPIVWERGQGRYSVTVEPLRDAGSPLIESVISGGARPASPAPSERRGWWACPASATSARWRPGESTGRTDDVRDCEGGQVRYHSMTDALSAVAQWRCPPGSFYEGASRAEVMVGGEWLPLVGRQSIDRAGAWRVSNGLVRWTVTPDDLLEVEWWLPGTGAWSAPRTWQMISYQRPRITWDAVEVTQNAAHAVTVRLAGATTVDRGGSLDWWVTVRRGSTGLDMVMRAASPPQMQMLPVPTTAVTDSGAHVLGPSEGDAVRWVYVSTPTWTASTANGAVYATSLGARTDWSWGLLGTQAGVNTLGVDEVVRSWYAGGVERVAVGVTGA